MNYQYGYYQPNYFQQPFNNDTYRMAQPNLQNQQQQNTPTTNGITWVQGEAGAKSFIVAPNNTAVLWDSESPVIYIKSADASGMPSLKVYDLLERNTVAKNDENTPKIDFESYVKKDTFEELKKQVEELSKKFQGKEEVLF